MNEDNNQDRSQTEGQGGIDRETEARNRENETGQAQGQQFGEEGSQPEGGQSPSEQDRGSSAFGQQGQSAGGDTTLSERTGQTTTELESGESGSENFVGSGKEDSSDYLTKGEEDQDFAAQGQGAQESDAGRSDIETGQSSERSTEFDDGSDSDL